MAPRDEYYALLSRAVAGLDRDAYAARGAVYDREHKALLRRLFAANSRLADAEIDEAQWAFREAIRRIEFGDESDSAPLVPYRAASHEALADVAPPEIPIQARDLDRPALPDLPLPPPRRPSRKVNWSQRDGLAKPLPPAPAPVVPVNGDADARARADKVLKPKRSVFRRVAGRTLLALVLIAIGTAAYGTMTGHIQLPWLARIVGHQPLMSGSAASDRAILFDGELSEQPDEKNIGRAVWRSTLEAAGPDGAQIAVLYLDASVPQRNLLLNLSMRPEAGGSAMSHLLEFRFLRPDRQPDDSISAIGGIMTRTEASGGRLLLSGKVVKVAPGVFLFGLAGLQGVREMSMQQLKRMRWLDSPLNYTSGAKGILAIEKLGKGEQVVNDVLSKWEG